MKNAKLYLCKADSSILGTLTGIQAQTCNLTRNATDLWELTFEVNRYIDADGRLVQSDYYDSVDDMMRLYLDSADVQAYFVIDSEPMIKGDGYQETKSVTAHSIECELSRIYLNNLRINCGTSDSQEYLATETDQDGNINYYNVDPYTGLPYNYILLVNYDKPQLSLLHLVLQGTGWKVKEGIDADICQIKKSFETSDSIYSFLMTTVSPAASVIFEFDRKHKTVGIVNAADYGEDTGIFISMRNLMNRFEVTSTTNDSIVTKLVPTGANNLGIEAVNFGNDFILNLDYFMNTRNEYGDFKFVSRELHDKYSKWKDFRETNRGRYIELTKLYNQTLSDISELKNRVPNDGCMIDYKTYTLDELEAAHTAYQNALAALITIYKNEYGASAIGEAPDYTPTPENAVNIKDTPYWYDFYAYQESILPQVKEALRTYNQAGENKKMDSYLYEWSLYGLDELEAKKKAWSEAANLLFDECFIASENSNASNAATPTYRTPDESGWNSLDPERQKQYTSMTAYIDKLNQYLDYMSFGERYNSITNTKCKGIIRQCEDEIKIRQTEIAKIEIEQENYAKERKELASAAALEGSNNFGFTEKDLNIINGLIREQAFSNENIVTTSLDSIVTTVDIQDTLYQSAAEKLFALSQPQYSFKTEIDNLYALDAFKAYRKPFDIGNFIRVGLEMHEEICDNHFTKLRVVSISHNPLCADENLSVEFSTMMKSLNGINDLAFLLKAEGGTSSGSSSGSGTGGGGTYGSNDANVQISNNMLNALLRTEMFGTAVNDVILDTMSANKGNFNTLFAHTGVFGPLEAGNTIINGDCISTGSIKSNNYSLERKEDGETVETGSMLNLSNGTFSFAGGNLKWDNSKLYIGGEITASEGITETEFRGDVKANELTAKKGTIAGWEFDIEKTEGFYIDDTETGIHGKKYLGRNGILMGDLFTINNDGFILKDFILKKSINNFTLSKHNLTTDYDNTNPYRIYVYNYQHFDDNQYFNIFFHYSTSLDVTLRVQDGEHEYNNFSLDNIVCHYRIKKENIRSIYDLSQEESNVFLQQLNDSILIDNIGYIDREDWEFVTSNLDDACEDCMDGYTVLEHELSDDITHYGIYQKNPLIPDGYQENTYEDNWKHEWNVEPTQHKLELLGVCTSTDSNGIHILSDIVTTAGMALNSSKKKIAINDTYMTNKGFSSKYMYDNVFVSGKPLYINSDGTIGASGSSMRYKNSISTSLTEISDPHGLYDVDIVQYKYNNDYFSSSKDEGIDKYFIGFIAENIAEKFKDGATFDKDNLPDGWDIRYMFPAALKLIQEQHKELEALQEQVLSLKNDIMENKSS